ncbi:MAG: STAS domain-containing protein [Chitinophagales bacterium]
MEYTIDKKKNHTIVVKLDGRLVGEFQTIQLSEALDELIEEKYYRIVFDMTELEYINSTGLNFFLKILTKVRKFDGEVVVCSLNKLLKTLMVTTKLNSFFTICYDVADALGHLEKEKTL